MLQSTIQDALNKQIAMEMYASNLYLAMSAHFAAASLKGFAHWMRQQADEERGHALRIFDYIGERGGSVELAAIAQPPSEFGAPPEIFQAALEHERKVSASIHAIFSLAGQEADYATQSFLQWFINEQVEEEANATEMVDLLAMAGDNRAALLMLDNRVKGRE
jgi:ferritin